MARKHIDNNLQKLKNNSQGFSTFISCHSFPRWHFFSDVTSRQRVERQQAELEAPVRKSTACCSDKKGADNLTTIFGANRWGCGLGVVKGSRRAGKFQRRSCASLGAVPTIRFFWSMFCVISIDMTNFVRFS